jgi:hypothetical protein
LLFFLISYSFSIGQYYLPPYTEANLEFMRDVISGKKKLIKNDDVKIITVPNLPELSALRLCKLAHADRVISKYLPEYNENRSYNRKFLFTVINTVKRDFFPTNIREAMQRRKARHIA